MMTAQLASPVPFEPGVIVGGKYRIVSLIGVGGVGRVYLARHIELDTDVAIKVLKPEMSERPDAVQRFGREARASVRLRSERIARVLDVGSHEGKPYFVMEYLVGCNLLEAREQPNIDIATLCEFFIQACEGLADAHAQGVVHRDVKPENLFVVRDASGWRSLKVFDFGISKFSLTGRFSDIDVAGMRTESMMGTPYYISPEQIRSTHEVDHRTDLWSLGAVMFEVLAGGILPFREEHEVTALVAEVLERPHRSLLDVAPNIPERLAAIIDRCLVKDREFRYQTAAEVALDLLPLAPARARASVERAVSVMQAAGLMAINGDMESLRHVPTLQSDRPDSSGSRSSTSPVEELAQAPLSGSRTSEVVRASATPPAVLTPALPGVAATNVNVVRPPLPPRGAASPSGGSPARPASVPWPAAAPPLVSAPMAAQSTPPLSARSPAVTAPPIDHDDTARDKASKRSGVMLVLLLAGCLLLGLLMLSTRGWSPSAAPEAKKALALEPAPPIAQSPVAAAANLKPSATSAAAPASSSAASLARAPSAERKPPQYKPAWVPRPATAPVAAKESPTKSADLPSPPPSRLELRRER